MTDITHSSTDLTASNARHLTDRIRAALDTTWQMIRDAYLGRAWIALGYTSWDDYTTQEFGTARIRIPREERQEWVGSLRDSGLSIRAIAQATALSVGTIHSEVQVFKTEHVSSPVSDERHDFPTADEWSPDEGFVESQVPYDDGNLSREAEVPEPPLTNYNTGQIIEQEAPRAVTGLDGKTYTVPTTPTAPRRKALTESAKDIGWDLRKAADKLTRLAEDDRYTRNKEEVAALIRGHLMFTVEVCQDLLDTFNQPQED